MSAPGHNGLKHGGSRGYATGFYRPERNDSVYLFRVKRAATSSQISSLGEKPRQLPNQRRGDLPFRNTASLDSFADPK